VSNRAAIFVQRGGPPADRQIDACLQFCIASEYTVLALIRHGEPEAAVALAREHRVSVIVTGYDSKAVRQLAADIDGNGRVEVIHPEPRVIPPPKHKLDGPIGELIVRWFRRGKTVQEIAKDVESDTHEVRALIRRYGGDPGQSH
jgi:hypothetical protein